MRQKCEHNLRNPNDNWKFHLEKQWNALVTRLVRRDKIILQPSPATMVHLRKMLLGASIFPERGSSLLLKRKLYEKRITESPVGGVA